MRELAAVSSLSLTVTLVVSRPRLGARLVVGPALAAAAGVVVMLAAGFIGPGDAVDAADVLWRPLVAITGIMLTAAAALRLGVVHRLASTVLPQDAATPSRLFAAVFILSAATSAVLNNDSAVLLLTPLVVISVRTRYPDRADLLLPFAFVVFMAAGVAPLVTANPMNLVVAHYAGLNFNEYAVRMLPISLLGWVATYAVLRWIFRRELSAPGRVLPATAPSGPWRPQEWQGLALVLIVLGTYPVVSYLGGSVWIVASAGSLLAVLLCWAHGAGNPTSFLRSGVSWDILAFLPGVFMLAVGLRNAGVVDRLSDLYDGSGVVVIGAASAIGSAIINNHSMALTNVLAIRDIHHTGPLDYLAAVIGGDLGPRLLPMGSLAGLLWLASLRVLDVHIPLRRFVTVGAAVTVPTLALSLGLLALT